MFKEIITLQVRCLLFQVFFVFALTGKQARAQFRPLAPPRLQVDSVYLNNIPSKWSLRLYSVTKFQNFKIHSNTTNAMVQYVPSIGYSIGAGFSYYHLGLDLGLQIVSVSPDDNAHKSSSFDFIASRYEDHHGLEVYLQNTKGMFGSVSGSGLPPEINNATVVFRPDVRTFNIGVTYDYLFNPGKFSLNSINGTVIQKKSAGGAMAGIFFTDYDLRADSSIILNEHVNYFENHTSVSDANLFTLGLNGGYGYTLVMPFHFYFLAAVTPGIAFAKSDLKTDGEWYTGGNPLNVSFKLISRGALGYSGKKIYSVLSLLSDKNFINISNQNYFFQDAVKLKLAVGYRLGI